MKKSITIFLFFSLILFNIKPLNAFAQPITLSQGLYTLKEANLSPNVIYTVRNTSTGNSIVMVIDTNKLLQDFLRIEPNSPKYALKPFKFGDIIVIIGESKLEFS